MMNSDELSADEADVASLHDNMHNVHQNHDANFGQQNAVQSNSTQHNRNAPLSVLTFMFGNFDNDGQLEGDIFDECSKQQLQSISRVGFGAMLREFTGNVFGDDQLILKAVTGTDSDSDDEDTDDNDYEIEKSESAVDYSDITEAFSEDESEVSLSSHQVNVNEDYDEEDDAETGIDVNYSVPPTFNDSHSLEAGDDDQLVFSSQDSGIEEPCSGSSSKSDNELMPPPPPPTSSCTSHVEEVDNTAKPGNKFVTPLASMRPPKYANVDVVEFFPDFRADKQLHASTDPSSYGEPSIGSLSEGRGRHGEEGGSKSGSGSSSGSSNKPKSGDWRYGPAQLWYDMIDVPSDAKQCDYGFKVAPNAGGEATPGSSALRLSPRPKSSVVRAEEGYDGGSEDETSDGEVPNDAFHMITQYNWEDDIIWNGDDFKHKVQQKRKNMAAGWVPSSYNRTAQAFSQPSSGGAGGPGSSRPVVSSFSVPAPAQPASAAGGGSGGAKSKNPANVEDDTWYSIFPVENEDLVYSRWEDNIIWDPDSMKSLPEPPILTLDPNDENIILGIPEDVDPSTLNQEEAPVKVKIPHPHVKKSKILLGKAGVITTIEEESPPPPPKSPDKDPFNLSNDEYYSTKGTDQIIKTSMGGGLLQHSTPVVELQAPFIPTYMGEKKLRQFHRPPLKRFSYGVLASQAPHPVFSLQKEIKKKERQREAERFASGGGDVFFMRIPEDLTGKDGDLILVEYIEEYPPLLSQVGMCTRIKNYYKRRACNDKGPPEYRFGETSYAHTSPFLGSMHPGQSIQTLENNMYRAPLYEHKIPPTDFLVIRTRNGYSIRECEQLFTAGQECPLYEVPGPNSKSANNYVRDFLQVFIYRLFWKSVDEPRRIKMDEIKRAFPTHSESSIRKRLKPCADFKRTGVDSNWWVIKPEFRLPTEEEIRAMVSPEQSCGFGSMLAAEQRLKDAGYGDKFLSALEDDNEDDTQKLDDEVKVAPWHTTRAYIHAVKGKCLLQLTGPADPTGCGEGFSYVRIPNKPTQNKEEQEQQPKRTVTGTDADLRRLSLNNAKLLLKEYGVPDEEIKKLSRWEVIDVVRTLSTEKAKAGEEGMNKFSRGNRFSIAEHQERYKEECQRVFDLQNRVLASEEVLSTDEGSSEEEDNDSDMEEKGKYIENILANKKTSSQMTLEKEEQERRDLQKMMMGDEDATQDKKKLKKEEDDNSRYGFGTPGRILKITRTFKNAEGKDYQRVEYVRKTVFIDTYVKIRTTKDESFIKEFVGQLDDAQKEEMKRERRRLQEQLRRIKRNQEKAALGIVTPPRPKKPKLKPDLKLKCGACGQVGHMRTNKACPLYTGPPGIGGEGSAAGSVAGTAGNSLDGSSFKSALDTYDSKKKFDDSLEDLDKAATIDESEELVNVDGTKIKLSSKVVKHAEELKRRSEVARARGGADGDTGRGTKRRRAGTVLHCDYLKRRNKSVNRRRIDPVITLATILEEILNHMREMPDVTPFIRPVNAKAVPDYYNLVEIPMDLSKMREKLRAHKYQSREEFMTDVMQIVENSKLYNGPKSTLTFAANKMLELCIQLFTDHEDKLMRLEKAINPLLDDDDQVAFDFILDKIVQNYLVTTPDAWPFMKPVSKKNVKDYYEVIQNPMDLSLIAKKVKNHKYHSRAEFLSDLELINSNSARYNGPDSPYTRKTEALLHIARGALAEYESHLESLEKKIVLARERIAEAEQAEEAEDSMMSGEDDEANAQHLSPSRSTAGDTDSKPAISDLLSASKRLALEVSKSARSSLMDDLDYSDEDGRLPVKIKKEDTGDLSDSMMDTSHAYEPTQYMGMEESGCDLSFSANYDPAEMFQQPLGTHLPSPPNVTVPQEYQPYSVGVKSGVPSAFTSGPPPQEQMVVPAAAGGFSSVAADLDISESEDEEDMMDVPPVSAANLPPPDSHSFMF